MDEVKKYILLDNVCYDIDKEGFLIYRGDNQIIRKGTFIKNIQPNFTEDNDRARGFHCIIVENNEILFCPWPTRIIENTPEAILKFEEYLEIKNQIKSLKNKCDEKLKEVPFFEPWNEWPNRKD